MTNTFLDAIQTNDVLGENGMPAHSTTGTAVLDLFFLMGTRPQPADVQRATIKAWYQNPDLTLKVLFQSRDVREGKGERESFRVALRCLAESNSASVSGLVPLIAEYGRWDDLHSLFGTRLERHAIAAIIDGLRAGNGLCAKWQPRKGPIAETLRIAMKMSPKSYRKTLVNLTKVVESQMCAGQWDAIDFNKVPSKAGQIYAKAFFRQQAERYAKWREDLKVELAKPAEERTGKVKINTGALYPHEVVREARYNTSYPFDQAWQTMQEKFPEINEHMIAVCDVSGSMRGEPMDVSVALGLFLSQRNTGAFKNCFITFSENPQLQRVSGTLQQRVRQIETSNWDMNTNLEAVFRLVIKAAKASRPEDVPSMLLILSDMQFDECMLTPSDNALAMIDREFASIGLKRPQIVFWNLRDAGAKAVPVKAHQSGAALLSGYSPNMVKALLTNPNKLDGFTPFGIMLASLSVPRYERIKVTIAAVPSTDLETGLVPEKTYGKKVVRKKAVKKTVKATVKKATKAGKAKKAARKR